MTESTPLSVSVQSAIHGVLVLEARARGGRLGVPSCSLNEERGGSLEEHHNPIQVAFPPSSGEEGSRHKILSASAELTFECLLLCGLTKNVGVAENPTLSSSKKEGVFFEFDLK